MEYSAESVRYLHIAYSLFILIQVGYVGWLVVRWRRVQAQIRVPEFPATSKSVSRL